MNPIYYTTNVIQMNGHNCRYCSDMNHHLVMKTHSQASQKVTVWVGIIGNHIFNFYIEVISIGHKTKSISRMCQSYEHNILK